MLLYLQVRHHVSFLLGLVAFVLAACGRNEAMLIPPTATPPVPTAPLPTALPSPTPTPGYLDLVQAEGAIPTGHLIFSTRDEHQSDDQVQLWARSASRDDVQLLLEGTRDTLWDCAIRAASFCAIGDPSGQVYTLRPPEALMPLLPAGEGLQRVFLSPMGDFAGVVSGGFMALLDMNNPAEVVNVPNVPAVGDVAWSDVLTDANGVRLAFVVLGEQNQSLYIMRLGSELVPPTLLAQEDAVESPAWAGSQRRLAFVVRGLDHPRGGTMRRDVFIANLETDEYINVTELFGQSVEGPAPYPFGGAGPAWSPDGDTLDFVWVRADESPLRGSLFRYPLGGEPELLMPVLYAEGQGWSGPAWSPDGRMEAAVAPVEARGGQGELWMSPAGQEAWTPLSLPDQSVQRFVWSPDGAYLAYEVPGDGIWVVPTAGGEPWRVVAVGKPYQVRRLRWLSGGDEVIRR